MNSFCTFKILGKHGIVHAETGIQIYKTFEIPSAIIGKHASTRASIIVDLSREVEKICHGYLFIPGGRNCRIL